MTPRQRWERWRAERIPTAGSRMPLADYLVSNAQWDAHSAFIAEARGEEIEPRWVDDLAATVADLAALVRERGSP